MADREARTPQGTGAASAAATDRGAPKLGARMITGGLIGTVVEWYDWFCYGLLVSVFAPLIFPSDSAIASILQAFAVYAVGFLIRPLGALILSPLGDKLGRRWLMAWSIVTMGIASLIIAVLPTFDAVGLWSPAILLVARLLQGLSAAGEFQSGSSYLLENAPRGKRGMLSGLFNAAAGVAILLATVSANLVTSLISDPALSAWGWRLPFVLGAVLSAFGLWVRFGVPESHAFTEIAEEQKVAPTPMRTVVRKYPMRLLQIAAAQFVCVPYYLWSTFIPTYANLVSGIPLSKALMGNSLGLVLYLIALPTAGRLADRYGRKPLLFIGSIGLVIMVYPCFLLLHNPSFGAYLAANIIGWLLLSTIEALTPAIGVELLPPRVRVSGIGFSYQLVTAVLGGTAPLLASWFISIGHPTFIAGYVVLIMAVTALIFLTMPETKDAVVDHDPDAVPEAAADKEHPVD
jgi:MHS family alpha-ketoglutarate permease-like MFS transporter